MLVTRPNLPVIFIFDKDLLFLVREGQLTSYIGLAFWWAIVNYYSKSPWLILILAPLTLAPCLLGLPMCFLPTSQTLVSDMYYQCLGSRGRKQDQASVFINH